MRFYESLEPYSGSKSLQERLQEIEENEVFVRLEWLSKELEAQKQLEMEREATVPVVPKGHSSIPALSSHIPTNRTDSGRTGGSRIMNRYGICKWLEKKERARDRDCVYCGRYAHRSFP